MFQSHLRYLALVYGKYGKTPRRYRNLLRQIRSTRAKTILEVGVYRAIRSREMIETALLAHAPNAIEYVGFDLFEDLTGELCTKEFSKMPFTMTEIEQSLAGTGAHVELHKGFSQDTLPPFVAQWKQSGKTLDLAFIDGGHAIDTITSDWDNVKQLMTKNTVVMFDDYYMNQNPETKDVGCRSLIDALDPTVYKAEILDPEDAFEKEWGMLRIKLAKVTLR